MTWIIRDRFVPRRLKTMVAFWEVILLILAIGIVYLVAQMAKPG